MVKFQEQGLRLAKKCGESGPNKWGKFICGPQCLQPITFRHIENVKRLNNFKFNTDLFYFYHLLTTLLGLAEKNDMSRDP